VEGGGGPKEWDVPSGEKREEEGKREKGERERRCDVTGRLGPRCHPFFNSIDTDGLAGTGGGLEKTEVAARNKREKGREEKKKRKEPAGGCLPRPFLVAAPSKERESWEKKKKGGRGTELVVVLPAGVAGRRGARCGKGKIGRKKRERGGRSPGL